MHFFFSLLYCNQKPICGGREVVAVVVNHHHHHPPPPCFPGINLCQGILQSKFKHRVKNANILKKTYNNVLSDKQKICGTYTNHTLLAEASFMIG